jgi:hypothetical protein
MTARHGMEGEAMQQFDLPLVTADISAESALMTAIDAKRSGVVLRTTSGDLRLIDFKNLVSATENDTPLAEVAHISLLNIEHHQTLRTLADTVESSGSKFVYLGTAGDVASVLSMHEPLAGLYLTSSGARCARPNNGRPPGTPDQKWYHYYPPTRRDAQNPNRCRKCRSPIP